MSSRGRTASLVLLVVAAMMAGGRPLGAHSGPPYPIVSDRILGAYLVSIWTDPDTTDDRTPAGKFWVTLQTAQKGGTIPPGTGASVSIRPLDRPGVQETAATEPVNQEISRQFVALVMDHEGPFAVHVAIAGPLGKADVDANVDATYDLRPRPILMVLYLFPFALVGFLWIKLLIARRRSPARARAPRPS